MKEFDFYGTTGVIAPGMVLIVGMVILFFPDQGEALKTISDVSLGSLGVGMILAYVAGQLLQAIGNGLETVWWCFFGGMPTDWIRSPSQNIIAPSQRDLILIRLRIDLNTPSFEFAAADTNSWQSITRQINASIARSGMLLRVDIFNGNYGLCRGIASAFLVLLSGAIIYNWRAWQIEVALLLLMALAIYRMHRFGVRYARELFVQYIQAAQPTTERGNP